MLIWSHFIEEAREEIENYTHRFQEWVHTLCTQKIAEQLTVLFAHDEIRATCAYTQNENID